MYDAFNYCSNALRTARAPPFPIVTMRRFLLLLCVGVARAMQLPSACPAIGATTCHGGIALAGSRTDVKLFTLPELIELEKLQGLPYVSAQVGVCAKLTFNCSSGLGNLLADPTLGPLVSSIAGPCRPNGLFQATGQQYVAYAAFSGADCASTLSAFQLVNSLAPLLFSSFITSLELCNSSACIEPPGTPSAAPALSFKPFLAVAAALLLLGAL